MHITARIKFSLGALMTILVTACATNTGGDVALQRQYERTIPVCAGAHDCRIKMDAARAWVKYKTGLQILVDTDDRIETAGWSFDDVPAVKIDRAPLGGDRYWILVELNCGSAQTSDRFGARTCPPYWETSIDFNLAVSPAH